jgi:hypothetical protein
MYGANLFGLLVIYANIWLRLEPSDHTIFHLSLQARYILIHPPQLATYLSDSSDALIFG